MELQDTKNFFFKLKIELSTSPTFVQLEHIKTRYSISTVGGEIKNFEF